MGVIQPFFISGDNSIQESTMCDNVTIRVHAIFFASVPKLQALSRIRQVKVVSNVPLTIFSVSADLF